MEVTSNIQNTGVEVKSNLVWHLCYKFDQKIGLAGSYFLRWRDMGLVFFFFNSFLKIRCYYSIKIIKCKYHKNWNCSADMADFYNILQFREH